MALPLPEIDKTKENAWKWRGFLAGIADTSYDEYGYDGGWPGIPPYEAFEAIISRESNGIPDAVNENMQEGSRPIGLMQILPTGDIAENYKDITGHNVTDTSLQDPVENMKVGIIGFATKASAMQVYNKGDSWARLARMGWYGAGSHFGTSPWTPTDQVQCSDGPCGGDGNAWETYVQNYINGFTNTAEKVNTGQWRTPSDSTRESWIDPRQYDDYGMIPGRKYFVGTYDGIKDVWHGAVDTVTGTVDAAKSLYGFVTNIGNWVRIGVILLAVALVGLGTTGMLF